MANYETLKSAIQDVVKTNGNNEITGALLQQSLLAMINSLGAGYQFMGVAIPTTNPGTPDQKVFYIASKTGVYANFSGIDINDEDIVILSYDNSWHKLNTGIARNNILQNINQQINGFNKEYIGAATSYSFYDIQLEAGEYQYTHTGSSVRPLFIDANDEVVTSLSTNTSETITITQSQAERIVRLSIFNGTLSIRRAENSIVAQIENIASDVNNIKSDVKTIDYQINGSIYDKTFVGTSQSSYIVYPVALEPGNYNYEITDSGAAVDFIDANDNNVFTLQRNTSGIKEITQSLSERVAKVSIYKGQIRLTKDDTENSIVKRLERTENVIHPNTSVQKTGSYYQTFVKELKKYQPYKITLVSSTGGDMIIYGLTDAADTSNQEYLFSLGVGQSTLFAPSKRYEALYYGIVGTCTIQIEDYDGTLTTQGNHVFYCGASRLYTKLIDAIKAAELFMDSILYVDAGNYDLIEEFGNEYFESLTSGSTLAGIVLKNRIKIIFSANSRVTCNYTGNNQYVKSLFSPFNAGAFGFEIVGLHLECSNVRYAVHDERNGAIEQMKSYYRNCYMKLDNSGNDAWPLASCIGGGLGSNSIVDIRGCYFIAIPPSGNGAGIYYHNSEDLGNTDFSSYINICGNYCDGCGITLDEDRQDATKETYYLISNNHCAAITLRVTNPDAIVKTWNNDIQQ